MAAASAAQRPYQVVVWGATGFTGRLVCEHIAQTYQGKIRWAMAGRNARKLEQVKQDLVKINPDCQAVPVLLADADDRDSLSRLAGQTQCIVSTAGPFAKYGSNVVEASVNEGAHYCDITGELAWVRRMIDEFHDVAAQKGVKIVPCCGYDSVPSDLGTLMVVEHARSKLGKGVTQVYNLIGPGQGGVSGGTIESGMNMQVQESKETMRALGSDPYFLLSSDQAKGGDTPAPVRPFFNPYIQRWCAPFVMEVINSRVVHRSSALSGGYGPDFKFREAMQAKGLLTAAMMSVVHVAIGVVFMFGPLRSLAKRFLPKPGEGPSRELMTTGYFNHQLVALTQAGPGEQQQAVYGKVGDRRDAGYWSTSRMLLEAALCLVLQEQQLQQAGCALGGVLTPATAMGMVLVERLRAAGFTFEVTDGPQDW